MTFCVVWLSFIIFSCYPCSCDTQWIIFLASVYNVVAWIKARLYFWAHYAVACHVFNPIFSCKTLWEHEVLHVEMDFHVDVSRVKECVCNVKISFPINHLTLPAAFNFCRFTWLLGEGEGDGENENVVNLPSALFYQAMKELTYAHIIANSVNYMKNLRNTKSCMEPLSISQHLCFCSNSAS